MSYEQAIKVINKAQQDKRLAKEQERLGPRASKILHTLIEARKPAEAAS